MGAGGMGLSLSEVFTNFLLFWAGSCSGSADAVAGALFFASCFFLRDRRTSGGSISRGERSNRPEHNNVDEISS